MPHTTNLPPAAWGAQALRAWEEGMGKRLVVLIAPEPSMLEELATQVREFSPTTPLLTFPGWDVYPYDRMGPSALVEGARAHTQSQIQGGFSGILVTSVAALGVKVPPAVAKGLTLKVGKEISMDTVAATLNALGFGREDMVQEVGTWARRGGVIDVWPAEQENPMRLEWFGDELESIRPFDAAGQRALPMDGPPRKNLTVSPLGAGGLTPSTIARFRENYRDLFPEGTEDELYVAVSAGQAHPMLGQFAPLLWEEPWVPFGNLIPKGAYILLPSDAEEQAKYWEESVTEAYARRTSAAGAEGVRAIPPELLFASQPHITFAWSRGESLFIHAFARENLGDFRVFSHGFHLAANRHTAAVNAAKSITSHIQKGWRILLTAPTAPNLSQFIKSLEAEGAPMASLTEGLDLKGPAGLFASISSISTGFSDEKNQIFLLTEGDVFGRKRSVITKKRRTQEEMISHFSELRDGDYVVHEKHGIGRFSGIITMTIPGKTEVKQDFIRLFYEGDDRLFVPVENMDVLSRYKGAESGHVSLDKLGTGGWEIRKEKVKEDLLAMASELMATAAAREMAERPPVIMEAGSTGALYDEFCAGFPYPLTEDQQSVMEELETDLAKSTPMDRLVVGDVGFGKTEVALRAAFLVAAAGKQVAVVCPTTLLSRQHFALFQERFAGFPMKVAQLSRMVSAKQAKDTKAALELGNVDVVVGTHALLSKELKFRNLGLVVIDEEQRFGVAHKEKLKTFRAGADVLTLTATPIPRTLQMAVGGVKSLSLITTPPVDRQAITTYVLPWDTPTLAEAVKRELARGGQVYVVAPHIEDLAGLQDSLAEMTPNASVVTAHGQMGEDALEKAMTAFYEGEANVLLATTIIESGLDVPKANTLIVYRADRFGLAQLYQLRGRVGRSTARAFAYFVLPDGPLRGDAARRLQILQRLEGLGAGFTLASYDMDIRGFGNLLGKQQSGHIRDVGFELYAKMLKEAVAERQRQQAAKKGEKQADPNLPENWERPSVGLKIGISYLIPETYIPETATRLQLYRRLSHLQTEDDIADFREELTDRFGKMPAEVENLIHVVSLRNRAASLNIQQIDMGEKGTTIKLAGNRFANPTGLMGVIQKMAGIWTVRPDQTITIHKNPGEGTTRLQSLSTILSMLEPLI